MKSLPRACAGLVGAFLAFAPPCHAATTDPVGYVSGSYGSGYSLIGAGVFQPAPNAHLGTIISHVFAPGAVPVGTTLQTFTTGDYDTYQYTEDGWRNELGNAAMPFSLPAQFGAVLFLPSPTTIVFSGQVAWVDFDTFGAVPVAAPYSATIHLLQNTSPVGAAYFENIIGQAPSEGDAVLQLDPSGSALISRFFGGAWHDPFGGSAAPVIPTGYSAFFDLSGDGFAGFTLPNGSPVPEPGSALLALSGAAIAFRRRRS